MRTDFLDALHVLVSHGVEFVLIGGVAANALGSPSVTTDLDICYERSDDNLERLVTALIALGARLRGPGVPDSAPFQLHPDTLRAGDSFTFATRAAALDVLGTPSGTRGFAELRANATLMDFGEGLEVWVCSLEDLMRMKTAAGRPKDRIELEVLGALRDELERRD